MSDWGFVAIAFTVVWGGLAVYALVLARRVSQAGEVASRIQAALRDDGEEAACDSPPV